MFKHDCEECVFLGATYFQGHRYEMYFCDKQLFGPTILARFGDKGSDYYSGLALSHPAIKLGLSEAIRKGLYKPETTATEVTAWQAKCPVCGKNHLLRYKPLEYEAFSCDRCGTTFKIKKEEDDSGK